MDDEEIAERYLRNLKIGRVVYEPDGKVPPDFVVDGRIAVEVRRLNQKRRNRGLEKLAFALRDQVDTLLTSLGPPILGVSWFVLYEFRRPLKWKHVRSPVCHALKEFREAFGRGMMVETEIPITENFRLCLVRARTADPGFFFVAGGSSDLDEGGWVLPELQENLEICIAEKTSKIASVRGKYREWWLVLVDHIAWGLLDNSDRQTMCDWLKGKHNWDKLIVLSLPDGECEFESSAVSIECPGPGALGEGLH